MRLRPLYPSCITRPLSVEEAAREQCAIPSCYVKLETVEAELRLTREAFARLMSVLHNSKVLSDQDVLKILPSFEVSDD